VLGIQVSAADDGNTSAVLRRLGVSLPVSHLGDVTSLYVVPNIVHFIWFADSADKQLTFINYVSIVSAHRVQKPDSIWFHCNHLPSGEWWERLWRQVRRLSVAATQSRSKAVVELTNPDPGSDRDVSDSVNPSIQCANPNPDSRIR